MAIPSIVTNAPNLVELLQERLTSHGEILSDDLDDRIRGVLLGLAVGNLLGLDVEGWPSSSIERTYPDGVTEINPQEVMRAMDDDLAQAVELGESLIQGGDYVKDFADRLMHWDWENGRGIGGTTAAAIDLLRRGHPPLEAGRMVYDLRNRIAPNGGLMRCAPVALACYRTPDNLAQVSAETCVVTHYAPTCQWSCIIINAAIAALLNGVDIKPMALVEAAIRDGADNEVMERAHAVGADINGLDLDSGLIGHTLLCFQAGLWALQTSLDFESALVSVVNAGGDTDTNGAVVGAVLGARYGAQAIPEQWLACIPERERIENLAAGLLGMRGLGPQ